jgi:uncharacterized protein YbjT (DUF2867 family)
MTTTDNQTNTKQRALLIGATGLVGSNILHLLAKDNMIEEVRALTRRSLQSQDKSPVVKELITDFDNLLEHPEWFEVDLVFCALGTTIANARTKEAFRLVDFDYPLAVAKAARSKGARHFLMVSALGANPQSKVFYNRVKGELEEAILSLGYPSVTFARPSILLGERQEYRFGELIAKKISWLFPSPWAGVEARQVAAALVQAAHGSTLGVTILDNRLLRSIHIDGKK